jgi:carboxyl-terminal processing protease
MRLRETKHRAVLTLALVLTFAGGFGAGQIVRIGAVASSSLEGTPAYQAFVETWELIHENYVLADELDDDELIYGATSGMVDALGDTGHSSFMDPEDVATLDPYLTGTYVGIGVEIDYDGSSLTVISAFDGSPADRAGLLPGDRIVTIDGQAVDRVSEAELIPLLRGDEGTPVTVEIERDGEAAFEVTIVREEIVIDPVQWWMLPGDIAHIRLVEFSEESGRAFRTAVEAAVEAGAVGIVLDLRANPGGLVYDAIAVAEAILPAGTDIFRIEDADGNVTVTSTEADPVADLPIAVLIDEGTASCAEIIAAAVVDSGQGTTIGETTFGTGTLLGLYELSDGSMLYLGTALWSTPSGQVVWKVGLDPEIPVELASPRDRLRPSGEGGVAGSQYLESDDTQLQEAVEWLETTAGA